jgi:hypothetical protein
LFGGEKSKEHERLEMGRGEALKVTQVISKEKEGGCAVVLVL